jgi:hypothetical protein
MPERSSSELILVPPFSDPEVRVEVQTHVSTGTNPKTRPGISINLYGKGQPPIIGHGGDYRVLFGVIDRDQVRALRNLLTDFLLDYPDDH